MVTLTEASEFLRLTPASPVIDVRSPGEFSQGHIPGALNIPLFNDEERAAVGTLYKKSGRDTAVLKGLEFVGPKMPGFIKTLRSLTDDKDIRVHCWRGGMRSENMAWLFSQGGYRVSVLKGGYKAYRKFIRERLSGPAQICLIGGLTGSGKTEILHALGRKGEQILDLEQLACHKGSVFGSLGQQPQPTNEQFENSIFSVWSEFDLSKPVWMEDESRRIGNVSIPDPLYEKIVRPERMFRIESSRSLRVIRLIKEYAGFPADDLQAPLEKIREKLGDRLKKAQTALTESDFATVANIALDYYDKSYEFSVSRRTGIMVHTITVTKDDPENTASHLLDFLLNI